MVSSSRVAGKTPWSLQPLWVPQEDAVIVKLFVEVLGKSVVGLGLAILSKLAEQLL